MGGLLPQVWHHLDPGDGLAGRQQRRSGGRQGDARREVPLPGGRDFVEALQVWLVWEGARRFIQCDGVGLCMAVEQTQVMARIQKLRGEAGGQGRSKYVTIK